MYPIYNMPPNADYYMDRARQYGYPQMQPQQNQPTQPPFQQPVYQPSITALFVNSIDEARATRLENPMNTHIFLDASNNKIYTRKLGDNGTSVLQSYSLDNPPPMTSEQQIASLQEQVNALTAKLEGKKKKEASDE